MEDVYHEYVKGSCIQALGLSVRHIRKDLAFVTNVFKAVVVFGLSLLVSIT